MTFIITGLGTAIPPRSFSQDIALRCSLAANGATGRRAEMERRLYELSGVQKRHSVLLDEPLQEGTIRQSFYRALDGAGDEWPSTAARMQRYEDEAAPLAEQALRAALDEAHVSPQRISHLVTVSCTGFHSPGVDLQLIERLGLSAEVQRTHLGFMGCHAAVNGLRVAAAFASQQTDACVAMCAVELCTLHFHPAEDRDKKVANALFADGAAAVIGQGVTGMNGAPPRCRLAATGSVVLPDSNDAMTWRIGDHGFEMTLSNKVPALIREHVRAWLESWLARKGRRLSDIRSWAIHPGGPAIVDAVVDALELPASAAETSRGVLAEFGNMSSPTLLFILQRLLEPLAQLPCIALAFGPGLVAEAMLLE
ncbi:MAG: type III polyketide synthase [Pirellulales bacterium]